MTMQKPKSIEYCLDTTLRELDKNWKPDGDRAFLAGQELLRNFGLPNRHEFLLSIIDKLIKDGYAMLMDRVHPDDQSTADHYWRRTIITIDGHLFVKNGKSYQVNKKKEGRKDFAKTWGGVIIGGGALIWNILKEL